MQLKKKEDILLEIRQIKNLESIELKDIYLSIVNGKRFLVPGFLITYGEPSKILYLTTQDKYFEEYVRQIKNCYLEEKDHVIREGIMGKEYIKIDPLTRNVLLNGTLENLEELEKYYQGKESYDESLLFEEDTLKANFSIIEHHIKETAKFFSLTIGPMNLSEGRNGVYYIKTTIQNKPVILPIHYEGTTEDWKVEIGNILEKSIPLKVEGRITKDGINVECRIDEYEYYDNTNYSYKNQKGWKEREVYHKGKMLHWKKEELERKEDPTLNKWILDQNRAVTWYSLPWNAYMGVKEEDKCLEEDGSLSDRQGEERIVSKEFIYLSLREDSFLTKEYTTKRYYKKIDDRIVAQNVLLDKVAKTSISLIGPEHIIVETSFDENGPRGFYQKNLAGKYFYQVFDKNFSKESLKWIGREDKVEEASDLLDVKIYKKEGI